MLPDFVRFKVLTAAPDDRSGLRRIPQFALVAESQSRGQLAMDQPLRHYRSRRIFGRRRDRRKAAHCGAKLVEGLLRRLPARGIDHEPAVLAVEVSIEP